ERYDLFQIHIWEKSFTKENKRKEILLINSVDSIVTYLKSYSLRFTSIRITILGMDIPDLFLLCKNKCK
ncbi:hypothetical protein M569_00025, partial [Genlisea aurea]